MTDQYIDGVYNYCDRWCERCPLTARCRIFALEEEFKRGDDLNAAFWKVFDDLVERESEEWMDDCFGDEIEDELSLPEVRAWDDADESESAMDRDPMVSVAMEYAAQARQWLMQYAPSDEDQAETRLGAAPAEKIGREEALEVLHWYLHQIGIKLIRTMRGAQNLVDEIGFDDTEEDVEPDDEIRNALIEAGQRDRDGSAKVALIGIERSLGAWTILRDHFSEHEQTFRGFQRTLARLRRFIDDQIPGARVFQRPGFEYEV